MLVTRVGKKLSFAASIEGGLSVVLAKRLLAVDDDLAVLKLVVQVAEDLGFTVEAISRSELFREAYERFQPTVITLDIFMPEVDGIELIQWLADIRCPSHIIITSDTDTSYLRALYELGRQRGPLRISQLVKPFRVEKLREALLAPPESGGTVADRHSLTQAGGWAS
jgi:CheY-like chemotaxis protein